jgi:uncharacterized phage-like protein YoqJ
MRCLITGHRYFKLKSYDIEWIKLAIGQALLELNPSYALSGMASGVDLWFCQSCLELGIPYSACIPFEEQKDLVEEFEKEERGFLIDKASDVISMRNSAMVEKSDCGIVVWDGNKGGTHNVVQQLIEKDKKFIWINPAGKKIWNCF